MVSRLSLIKSVPWLRKVAEAARVWAALTACLLNFMLLTLNVTFPFPSTLVLPSPSRATPAVKVSVTLSFVKPRLISFPLLISVIDSPTLILLPPAMWMVSILVFLRSPLLILSTGSSSFQSIFLKAISLKFCTEFVLPLQPSMVRVLPVLLLLLLPYRLAFSILAESLIMTSLS